MEEVALSQTKEQEQPWTREVGQEGADGAGRERCRYGGKYRDLLEGEKSERCLDMGSW